MDPNTVPAPRLVIVSNRLPFTVTEAQGKLEFQASAGGLVTGLSTYLQRTQGAGDAEPNYVWVGWPGISLDDPDLQEELRRQADAQFHAHPVFVDEAEMDRFYHGFCNETIWPLFHYFPTYTTFEESGWQTYQHVNQLFCEAVLEVLQPGDMLWVHDYHLMLLPQMVRAARPDVPIGFFLHIPFPAYEIFRLLPHAWRAGILEGLLGADLLGFHTYEYTQYFARAVLRVLGRESNLGCIPVDGRNVQLDTFPMGIDYPAFHDAPATPEVQEELSGLREQFADVKVILSIDRLDYSKGIINRLEGYQVFLQEHADWLGRVVLAVVVIPSRDAVDEYQETKTQIEELVGRINGEFGSIRWTPILYQYRSVPFPALVALYNASAAALITPLRDGMNLIAKEYVASRADAQGVLILSDLTGAATELGEAVLITPTSREEIAAALLTALEMPTDEQRRRMQLMQQRLADYDVTAWAADFIEQLGATNQAPDASTTQPLDGTAQDALLTAFRAAGDRRIILDYDGTLVGFAPRPEQAVPGADVCRLLDRLAADPHNTVVLCSGRDKSSLGEWFGALPVALVAEHGAWIRPRDESWRTPQPLTDAWKASIRPLLERYAHRLPGAFVEEKSFSLAWHYRRADPELGPIRAKELLDHLVTLTANIDVRVLQGNRVVEVRPAGVNKGLAVQPWLPEDESVFVLAIGDDWTDEDLFTALPASAYTIKVGHGPSAARYRLETPSAILALLTELAAA